MVEQRCSVKINPDHTHFIFVDDGTEGKFGGEINFRTQLEQHIRGRDNKVVPKVLIVVEGGAGTIETVKNALFHSTPIILVKVSFKKRFIILKFEWLLSLQGTGGCADLILKAWKKRDKYKDKTR